MIGIPLAILASNAAEWVLHKRVLHARGRDPSSHYRYHLADHHAHVLHYQFYDPDYEVSPLAWGPHGKEIASLVGISVALAPLLPVAPFFVVTSWACAARYYHLHKKSHLDPEWAREHLPWHYDHHMAPDQEANWCVTRPWFDHVMGTRKVYKGTPREARDWERRRALRARREAAAKAPA